MENFVAQHDDPIPIISFLNQVNQLGYIYQPKQFEESCIYSSKDFSTKYVREIHHNTFVDDKNKPVNFFSSSFEKEKLGGFDFVELIKGILHPDEKNEESVKACNVFCKLIHNLESIIKKIFEILLYVGELTLYEKFANHDPVNHITGNDWKNFGETLLNTPDFIFSDDTKDAVGYLVYENGKFYHTKGKDSNEKVLIGVHFPKHYNSPVTLEDLVAIVKLAEAKKKIVRVFGSCHSWSPIHTTNGILVDNRRIGTTSKGVYPIKIVEKDKRTDNPKISKKGQLKPTVTTYPGMTTGKFEQELWKKGYSLEASTIEDVFTMGGICFTSSHGTGKNFTCSSDLVIAMTIVCSNGKVVEISPQECVEVDGDKRSPATWLLERGGVKLTPEDVWRAAQVNLGAFGIVYDVTLLIRPKMHALFVSEAAKWEDYFGTDPSCAQKLSDLNNEWETLEFWQFPLTVDNIYQPNISQLFHGSVTFSPYVTITKTMTDKLTDEQSKIYNVVEKNYYSPEFVAQLAFQSIGSKFASTVWKWVVTLYNTPIKFISDLGRTLIKYIIVMTGWLGKIRWGKEPVYKDGNLVEKGEVWKIPQWIANHPVLDATAVVELIPCLDIEWEMNIPKYDPNGLKNVVGAYGHLLRSVKDRFEHDEYPVSINIEMRFLRGSSSPMSMQFNHQPIFDSEEGGEKSDRGYAAPEIVSNSPNPWWTSFYEKMNKEITCYQQQQKTYGENIRVHHAKQYSSLEGMLKYIRGIYDDPNFSSYPNPTYNTSFKLWKEVRSRFDVSGVFINPHIDQFFYNLKDTYSPVHGYFVSEGGDVRNTDCIIL